MKARDARSADWERAALRADVIADRIKNASLGDFVECLAALASCYRQAVVDGEQIEPVMLKIANQLVGNLDEDLPDRYEGTDAEFRREMHVRVRTFLAAMKPLRIADLMDEMAEAYRDVLLHQDAKRLARFHSALSIDIALVGNAEIRRLIDADRAGQIEYEMVETDRDMVLTTGAAAVS